MADIKDALLALELSGAAGVSERIETCKKLVATFLQNAHGLVILIVFCFYLFI